MSPRAWFQYCQVLGDTSNVSLQRIGQLLANGLSSEIASKQETTNLCDNNFLPNRIFLSLSFVNQVVFSILRAQFFSASLHGQRMVP